MNNIVLQEYNMDKPGAEQSDQNPWHVSQIKVGNVTFAIMCKVQGRR